MSIKINGIKGDLKKKHGLERTDKEILLFMKYYTRYKWLNMIYTVLFWFVIELLLLVIVVLQGHFEILVSFSFFIKANLKF